MGYRSFSQAMQARFGTKVYKLSLDGGMTCPNRDGTLGTRGCLFCGETGSGDFAAPHCGDIAVQLAQARRASPESTMVKNTSPTFKVLPTPMLPWHI